MRKENGYIKYAEKDSKNNFVLFETFLSFTGNLEMYSSGRLW